MFSVTQIFPNHAVDVVERQVIESVTHVVGKFIGLVILTVHRIAELSRLAIREQTDKLAEERPRRSRSPIPVMPSVDQLLELIHCHSRREMRIIIAAHRADPDLEDLLLAAKIGVRMKLVHAAREILDVRVVTVIHAARFANALEQMRVSAAVLAKIRTRQPQCDPILVATLEVDRESERDCHGRRFLLDNHSITALEHRRRRCIEQRSNARLEFLQIVTDRRRERFRIATRQPDSDVRDCVVLTIERLHVIERYRFDVRNMTKIQRAVGVLVAINRLVQVFLAQFLVIVANKVGANRIRDLRLDALEILSPTRPGKAAGRAPVNTRDRDCPYAPGPTGASFLYQPAR